MKKKLFFEEAILDDLAQEFDYLELPLSEKAFRLVAILVLGVAAIVVIKIILLGYWQKSFYDERALLNASQITTFRAERGIILDKNGKPLLNNLPAFRLNLSLPEVLRNNYTREETFSALESILNFPPSYLDDLAASINLEKQSKITVSRDLTIEQVIKIKNLNLSGVQVENDFKRQYLDGPIFSHILGYLGAVSKNDLSSDSSLSINDTIGKSGIEGFYDRFLRGEDGEVLHYRNATGKIIGEKTTRTATPGNELFLTIDSDLQKYFYERLKSQLAFLGSRAGAGIAMNPQTGEILALVSLPSFDNNKIQGEDLVNSAKPLFNRTISGLYSPGSTIKPLVAFAALREGVISSTKKIYSPGYLDLPNPYNPNEPTRFLDWRPQGWVDIYSALAKSSNVYFYEVGGGFLDQPGLGIYKLKEYWQKFGLDKKTGIDLPAENSGFLPDPETKEKNNKGIWRIGDTYNTAIGQGDLIITPIELINYFAAIANGGKFHKPFILNKIETSDGKIIKKVEPEMIADISQYGDIIEKVQQGMIDGVAQSYGTSHLLADLPVSVAAKTGTAQINFNTRTNAFFVGYAPAEGETHRGQPTKKPRVVLLVLIENAREGSLNAVPVAKDVFQWYYENRLQKQ